MSDLEARLEATRVDLFKRLAREDKPLYGLEALVRRIGRITLRNLTPTKREDSRSSPATKTMASNAAIIHSARVNPITSSKRPPTKKPMRCRGVPNPTAVE